jgi:hypothetical protein
MRSTLRWTLAIVLLAALAGGCGKKANDPLSPAAGGSAAGGSGGGASASADRAGASSAIASTPQLVEDGIFEAADQGTLGGMPGTLAAIRPVVYWRTINHVDRNFDIAFGDNDESGRPTTAVVTVEKFLTGSFNILAGPPPATLEVADSAQLSVIRKPLADHWVRRVLLQRVPLGGDAEDLDPHRGWRVVGSSGVDVTSRNATTHIVSLRVQAGPLDTLITDPLAFFRLRRMLRFDVADSVELTVRTLRNDDVVVLMFRGLRTAFRNNGDNTYTRVWRTPPISGVVHLGVNAFSRGTLFDDASPYDSEAWLLPYVVRPTMMAEYMP